jgi:adenylate kinase family enzyme
MIIGGPGAGKTWLAASCAAATGLPVISVDDVVWDAEGRLRPPEVVDAALRAAVLEARWIIEGGASRTFPERARRADLLVRLAPPLWRRLIRGLQRDGPRRDMLRATLIHNRHFREREQAAVALAAKAVELRTSRCVRRLLAALGDGRI